MKKLLVILILLSFSSLSFGTELINTNKIYATAKLSQLRYSDDKTFDDPTFPTLNAIIGYKLTKGLNFEAMVGTSATDDNVVSNKRDVGRFGPTVNNYIVNEKADFQVKYIASLNLNYAYNLTSKFQINTLFGLSHVNIDVQPASQEDYLQSDYNLLISSYSNSSEPLPEDNQIEKTDLLIGLQLNCQITQNSKFGIGYVNYLLTSSDDLFGLESTFTFNF